MSNEQIIINIRQGILKAGSISGLLSLIYNIRQGLKKKPKIKFDYAGRSSAVLKDGDAEYYTFQFTGTLKNQSDSQNSIVKIRSFARDKQKSQDCLDYGFGSYDSITNRNTGEAITLPISFGPKEAKEVIIDLKLSKSGRSTPSSSEADYELGFEDINENIFGEDGRLINEEIIGLKYTLTNSTRNIHKGIYWPFIRHKLTIFFSKIRFKWKILLQSIGLW